MVVVASRHASHSLIMVYEVMLNEIKLTINLVRKMGVSPYFKLVNAV